MSNFFLVSFRRLSEKKNKKARENKKADEMITPNNLT
jgi:hypothetical protein